MNDEEALKYCSRCGAILYYKDTRPLCGACVDQIQRHYIRMTRMERFWRWLWKQCGE